MLAKIWEWVSLNIISPINWNALYALFNKGVYWDLTEKELNKIRELLSKDHYVIVIRRKTHLTTYLIAIGTFIRTGKLAYWSHTLCNLEDKVKDDFDYRLLEAVGSGVKFSSFMEVFDCQSVALLKPYCFTNAEWTEEMPTMAKAEGKKYDTVFSLANEEKLSCCELIYLAIKKKINSMPIFCSMIKKYKNLMPDMYYDCGEFEVVYEVRH